MASSSSVAKVVEGKEVQNLQLISNDIKQPNFRVISDIAYKQDPSSAFSMIPPWVLMIQDIRCYYTYKVGSIRNMEIRETYEKLCENRALNEEYKIVEKKRLMYALDFPNVFKIE